MPPKSQKRTKRTHPNPVSGSENTTTPGPNKADSSLQDVESNASNPTKGFLLLPAELLLKIIEDFPKIQYEDILSNPTHLGGYIGAPFFQTRFRVLRALSQTCRRLRGFYLPLLWERFEACLIPRADTQWFRYIGEALARKSEGLLKSKHLWPYVQIVTVCLTRYKTDLVLPPFVKLLGALPNVHTLEIPHTHSAMTSALKNAFEGSKFSTIRTVIMPNCAHEVLRCCPHIESVTCNEDDGGRLASALTEAGCGALQVARGLFPGPNLLKRKSIGLTKAGPPLRVVRVRANEAEIRAFSTFPSLRVIEIECSEKQSKPSVMELVEVAKGVLRACAAYVPPPKPRKGRGAQKNIEGVQENPTDLYKDARVVKVIHYLPERFRQYATPKQSALSFIPLSIETFPVDV